MSAPNTRAISEIFSEVVRTIQQDAGAKGYALDSNDGGAGLLHFVAEQKLGHIEGEMIYKIIRWHSRRNRKDLIKLIAWAILRLTMYEEESPKDGAEEAGAGRAAQGHAINKPNIPVMGGYSDFPLPANPTLTSMCGGGSGGGIEDRERREKMIVSAMDAMQSAYKALERLRRG